VECIEEVVGSHRCEAHIVCGAAVASLSFYLNVGRAKDQADDDNEMSKLLSKLTIVDKSVHCTLRGVVGEQPFDAHPWVSRVGFRILQFTHVHPDEVDVCGPVLGHGSFGKATLARLRSSGRQVVVKTLLAKATKANVGVALRPSLAWLAVTVVLECTHSTWACSLLCLLYYGSPAASRVPARVASSVALGQAPKRR